MNTIVYSDSRLTFSRLTRLTAPLSGSISNARSRIRKKGALRTLRASPPPQEKVSHSVSDSVYKALPEDHEDNPDVIQYMSLGERSNRTPASSGVTDTSTGRSRHTTFVLPKSQGSLGSGRRPPIMKAPPFHKDLPEDYQGSSTAIQCMSFGEKKRH